MVFRKNQFRSQNQGFNLRRIVYACLACGWHTTEGKVPVCPECKIGDHLQHFDSYREFLRHQTLKMLASVGQISQLEIQPRFPITILDVHGQPHKGCTYVADFKYLDATGQVVVEDCKPKSVQGQTDVFKLKARLFQAAYGLPVTIVG